MAEGKVRIGFIGAGSIARSHIRRLTEEVPEAEIAAVADTIRSVAEEAAPEGAEVFEDYHEMLGEVGLDAVYACVPPDAHGDMEVVAAKRGIHLFVEKPVNRTMKEALRVDKALSEAGVITAVGYSLRHFAFFDQLKAVLRERPAYQAVVIRWGGLPDKAWWKSMKSSGGQLVEMVTHQMDLLRALMGEVKTVAASYGGAMHTEKVDIPSNYSVVLEIEGGKSAVVSSACGAAQGRNDMVLLAREAVIEVNYGKGIVVRPENAFKVPEVAAPLSIDAAFVKAVQSGDRSVIRSDYKDAIRSLAVSLACNLSAEEGRMVAVDELLK